MMERNKGIQDDIGIYKKQWKKWEKLSKIRSQNKSTNKGGESVGKGESASGRGVSPKIKSYYSSMKSNNHPDKRNINSMLGRTMFRIRPSALALERSFK